MKTPGCRVEAQRGADARVWDRPPEPRGRRWAESSRRRPWSGGAWVVSSLCQPRGALLTRRACGPYPVGPRGGGAQARRSPADRPQSTAGRRSSPESWLVFAADPQERARPNLANVSPFPAPAGAALTSVPISKVGRLRPSEIRSPVQEPGSISAVKDKEGHAVLPGPLQTGRPSGPGGPAHRRPPSPILAH